MLRAHDIMNPQVITVPATMTIGDLVDLLQRLNIHAAPVLNEAGDLAGMVTQEDVLYGTMGGDGEPEPQGASSPGRAFWSWGTSTRSRRRASTCGPGRSPTS